MSNNEERIKSEYRKRHSGGSSKRIRNLERQVGMLWVLFFIIIVGVVVGLIHNFNGKIEAKHIKYVNILSDEIKFDADAALTQTILDNYMSYLHKAYILYGTYPNYEYYKISNNVARNEYDWSKDFYVDEGKLYYNYYKDGKALGKPGIDVSEFQKEIDWEKVKGTGMQVAIIRLGYRGYGKGTIVKDARYEENIKGATDVGLETGVYFFSAAINRDEGIEEANYCIENLQGKKITQPVIIDTEYVYEDAEARSNVISVEDRTAAVVGFCETIEAAGYTPMIYASQDQFIKYLDIDQIGKWDFWLAAYDTPFFPYHTEGYQYAPSGYVDGVDTLVDLNVWMR